MRRLNANRRVGKSPDACDTYDVFVMDCEAKPRGWAIGPTVQKTEEVIRMMLEGWNIPNSSIQEAIASLRTNCSFDFPIPNIPDRLLREAGLLDGH